MLFANIGVSCRLWASEIGLRAPRKTSNGIPCWPRKSINSGVAMLCTVVVNSHVLSSIFLTAERDKLNAAIEILQESPKLKQVFPERRVILAIELVENTG